MAGGIITQPKQGRWARPGNTKGGSITVPLTSCLTGLDESVLQMKKKFLSSHTADSKPVKQEVNGTVILPPLVFLGKANEQSVYYFLSTGQKLHKEKFYEICPRKIDR